MYDEKIGMTDDELNNELAKVNKELEVAAAKQKKADIEIQKAEEIIKQARKIKAQYTKDKQRLGKILSKAESKKKRIAENHRKYQLGGLIVKYADGRFPTVTALERFLQMHESEIKMLETSIPYKPKHED